MRTLLRSTLVLLTTAGAVWPAVAAASSPAVAWQDACGDNRGYLFYDARRVDVPSTDRTDRFDLRAGSLRATGEGVAARFEMCSPIGEPDGVKGFRSAYASIDERCTVGLAAEEHPAPRLPRRALFFKSCYREPRPGPFADTVDERFTIELPASAVRVDGATMTIRVGRAGLTGEAAAALAPGTAWRNPGSITVEGPTLWGFGGDSEGHTWGESAPSAYDFAGTGGLLVIG
jgi:hypothetical protein